jgi:hypothetical protein
MKKFKRTLNKTDLNLTAVSLDTANFVKVGYYKVPAQQFVTWGNTEMVAGQPQGAVGYIDLRDGSNNPINGLVRLSLANAAEVEEKPYIEERTEKFRASQYDRSLGVLIPEFELKAKQDSFLLIKVKGDTSSTISVNNSTILLPITVYY